MDEPMIQTIPQDPTPTRHKTPWWKFAVGFLVIIALCIIVDAVWVQYFSPAAQNAKQMEEQYVSYEQQQKTYEEAMAQDTYGGKTPEETLALFIAALEKEDVDLASKYFSMDINLSKQKWVDFLTKLKNEGNMKRFAGDLKNTNHEINMDKDTAGILYTNKDNMAELQINMKLNNQIKIWKIESL